MKARLKVFYLYVFNFKMSKYYTWCPECILALRTLAPQSSWLARPTRSGEDPWRGPRYPSTPYTQTHTVLFKHKHYQTG